VEHHGFEIYRCMAALRGVGARVRRHEFGGPAIAVITGRPEVEVAEILADLGLRIAISTTVDNEGLKVSVERRE
jgi:hypothetical protein